MATAPHQRESLADKITRLKEEREEWRNARRQVLALGQSVAAGGTSTTYPSLKHIDEKLSFLDAVIESLTAQLTDDVVDQPGVNHLQVASDYT